MHAKTSHNGHVFGAALPGARHIPHHVHARGGAAAIGTAQLGSTDIQVPRLCFGEQVVVLA